MRTSIYVDGFNLYYGCLKGTPYRWLDPKALATKLLRPGHEIGCIKYFTAKVRSFPNKPNAPARQDAYIRALRSLPELEVIYGHFLSKDVWRSRTDGGGWVQVVWHEEKGSDVNLATHLIADAYEDRFEAAIVISNDSDLCEPIRIATSELGRKVGVFLPVSNEGRTPSKALKKVATFWKPIRKGAVQNSQFPDEVVVDGKSVTRPTRWK